MKRSGMFKLTGVFVLIIVCGCIYQDGTVYVAATGQPVWPPVPEHLFSPKQLAGSGLEILWQNELPIKQGESLDKLIIFGDKICVMSNRNFLTALNRNDGQVIFSRVLGESGFPIVGLSGCEGLIFATENRRLVEMNSQTGADVRVTVMEFTAACPAVRNSGYFYVAGTDRRIRAFHAADMVKLFEVAAPDNSPITAIVADEQFVIFTTDTGRCISFDANAPKYLWQFNAEGGIAPPAVKNDDSVFFASRDTYVYKFADAEGKFIWKCPMGAILEKGPDVAAKCVYQYARGRGLAAIDRKSGKILWRLPEGVSLVAETADKAYLASSVDGIITMDLSKDPKPSGTSLPGVSRYAVNVTDSKIYVADGMGRVACLKPVK